MCSPLQGMDKTAEERRIAICIFDDVAEQCREAALKYLDFAPLYDLSFRKLPVWLISLFMSMSGIMKHIFHSFWKLAMIKILMLDRFAY